MNCIYHMLFMTDVLQPLLLSVIWVIYKTANCPNKLLKCIS